MRVALFFGRPAGIFWNMIETKTLLRDDGRIEIVRVLNENALKQFKEWNPVAYEASVVWLQDISGFAFVRMMWATRCSSRRGELIPEGAGRILGYTRLTADAPLHPETGYYTRRIFYLRPQDEAPDVQPPVGSVDPNTVLPGVVGTYVAAVASATEAPKVRVRREAAAAELVANAKPHDKAKLKEKTPLATLTPENGEPYIITRREVNIGRSLENDLVLSGKAVSSRHCRLFLDQGNWWVLDLHSTHGLQLNGKKIKTGDRSKIDRGDKLSVAEHVLTFQN